MKTITYSVSITKPCQENWDKMLPSEKGRHCLHCQKNVIDFTSMRDEEIVHVLHSSSNLCGRFQSKQLERPVSAQIYTGKHFKWQSAIMVLLLSLFSFKTMAMPHRKVVATTEQLYSKMPLQSFEKALKGPDNDTGKIIIKGQVLDSLTDQAMSGALVILKNIGIRIATVVTNDDGEFVFKVYKMDSMSLTCRYLGYEDQNILIGKNLNKRTNLKFRMSITQHHTMGIIISTDDGYQWWNRLNGKYWGYKTGFPSK